MAGRDRVAGPFLPARNHERAHIFDSPQLEAAESHDCWVYLVAAQLLAQIDCPERCSVSARRTGGTSTTCAMPDPLGLLFSEENVPNHVQRPEGVGLNSVWRVDLCHSEGYDEPEQRTQRGLSMIAAVVNTAAAS